MPSSDKSGRRIHRRDLNKGAATAGLALTAGALGIPKTFGQSSFSNDLIQAENAKPGTRDWLLTKTHTVPGKINKILDNGRCKVIEGYCSANSIRVGETLRIMMKKAAGGNTLCGKE